MKWTEQFKTGMGRYFLARKIRSLDRKVHACNLGNARQIGIIYNATEYISFEIIRDLVRTLSEKSEKVSVLGYVDSKKLIDHYLYRKGFDFFSRSDLNWYYKPISPAAVQFMNEPFDLLMDLSLDDHFPIRYITSVSPSTFKAGRFMPEDETLDFMIDIEKEKQSIRALHEEITRETNPKGEKKELEADMELSTEKELQLKFLINQMIHYLSLINA